MVTYFISDIHLQPDALENTNLFLDFLQTKAIHADALYILGDLFSIWFGDDLQLEYAQKIAAAIKQLTVQNVPVYFICGNRDFLLGKQFCQQAGIQLLADPCKIQLYGHDYLLSHGDLLCSADIKYQKYRSFVQNPIIKKVFLSLPKYLRIKIGLWVQSKASSGNRNIALNNPSYFDVSDSSVIQWFGEYKIARMIHGHTHKPAVHQNDLHTRYVLGDWNPGNAQILSVTRDGANLINLYTF